MKEPLEHFYSIVGFDSSTIREIVPGEKYVSIMLKNGRMGVCSTLRLSVTKKDTRFSSPDLAYVPHRIVYNAYLNATLNYSVSPENQKDIFDHIDFSRKESVVMVGNFRPLVHKFRENGFPLSVFDRIEDDPALLPYERISEYLATAKTVILTSTTLFNNTFTGIMEQTHEDCTVFMLGPSSILHHDLKKYKNISGIYGMLFGLFDFRVSGVIRAGHGTQSFLKYAKKVNI
jgi:uncharacterized protein (DUF4213/DUF364 family)